jgi:predicted RNA binding protein with dsRBD fold (UPF0201 family)
MDTKQLKKLTEMFSAGQIQTCIRQQLDKGENSCDVVDETDEVIAALSKAEVVRELMEQKGLRFSEALRELGRRIRAVYGSEDESKG